MEILKHECGVALIRLLKPQDYYKEKYGTAAYALNKLYLMMEKQHNRGQEGAGIACVDMNAEVGTEYMFRERALGKDAIGEVFSLVTPEWTAAQLFMGHLRYSTTGKSGLQYVHPFLRRNNWRAKNLCLCGNFNMTNIEEIFEKMVRQGQSPRIYSDSYITLERMGHRLDREVERIYADAKGKGLEGTDITQYIEDHIQMANVLRTTMGDYDGGYVMCGMTGSGEMFAMRDPWGIRPSFFYRDDEVVAVASERAVLQTTFDLQYEDVHELPAGGALLVHKDGSSELGTILEPKKGCRLRGRTTAVRYQYYSPLGRLSLSGPGCREQTLSAFIGGADEPPPHGLCVIPFSIHPARDIVRRVNLVPCKLVPSGGGTVCLRTDERLCD